MSDKILSFKKIKEIHNNMFQDVDEEKKKIIDEIFYKIKVFYKIPIKKDFSDPKNPKLILIYKNIYFELSTEKNVNIINWKYRNNNSEFEVYELYSIDDLPIYLEAVLKIIKDNIIL